MKELLKTKFLPIFAVGMGIGGMILRWALYAFCLDEKRLLPQNHPLEWLLWAVTAAVLGLILAAAWKLDGSERYEDNFSPSAAAALGHILAAVGILLTTVLNQPVMDNYLGKIWKVLGILSGVCLSAAAYCRMRGKRPFFLLHMIPCLFLLFHIIDHYQQWSGTPQLLDYVFTLFGTIALMFFGFYTAAFDVGSGRRRMHLGMGLAAVYLCLVNLPQTEYLFLYVGGIAWVLSDLCTLNPKPRPREPEEGEKADDAA